MEDDHPMRDITVGVVAPAYVNVPLTELIKVPVPEIAPPNDAFPDWSKMAVPSSTMPPSRTNPGTPTRSPCTPPVIRLC